MKLPPLWRSWIGRVPEIKPAELHRWLEEGRPLQVVDARTGLEYQQGTIGRALHAPVTDMPHSMEHLDLDASRPVVVLCLSGHRSRPGTRWLLAHGLQAYSLRGGVLAWRKAGYPLQLPKE